MWSPPHPSPWKEAPISSPSPTRAFSLSGLAEIIRAWRMRHRERKERDWWKKGEYKSLRSVARRPSQRADGVAERFSLYIAFSLCYPSVVRWSALQEGEAGSGGAVRQTHVTFTNKWGREHATSYPSIGIELRECHWRGDLEFGLGSGKKDRDRSFWLMVNFLTWYFPVWYLTANTLFSRAHWTSGKTFLIKRNMNDQHSHPQGIWPWEPRSIHEYLIHDAYYAVPQSVDILSGHQLILIGSDRIPF